MNEFDEFPTSQKVQQPLLVCCLLLLFPIFSLAQRPFVTTWAVEAGGTIYIPANGPYTYDYEIDWDYDGVTFTADVTGATGKETSPAYTTAGNYQVAIRGTFPAIYFDDGVDKLKISAIDQWGDIAWKSMNSAFNGCANMGYTATDIPDLTEVTDMGWMFGNTGSFNADLSDWDVSSVTNMSGMFAGAASFNGDLSNWNTAAVANMDLMFLDAISFNGDLSTWNTAAVSSMVGLFSGASAFNADLSDWNTASVTNMYSMFADASSFDSDLSAWNTSLVYDMGRMFSNASLFNSDLNDWNTALVTNMGSMFEGATSFNGDLSDWNTAAVTDMSSMFTTATSFNGDLSAWNTAAVTNMIYMFAYASSFNGDLSDWNTSSVTNMYALFLYATSFNGDLSRWNTSSVTDMGAMFSNAASFNGDLSAWNTGSVINMGYMFEMAISFNSDLSLWDVSKVKIMSGMLDYCGMSTDNYDNTLIGWEGQFLQYGVRLDANGLVYCAGAAARASMIANEGWVVSGDVNECDPDGMAIKLKVMLDGPYNSSTLLMDDLLKMDYLLPITEPYTALGLVPVNSPGGETIENPFAVYWVTGKNAIVDWVQVELRDPANDATVLVSVNGLLQRDGDIVGMDGVSSLFIPGLSYGAYFVSIRHRNHLPVMTATAQNLTPSGTLDFTTAATAIYSSNGRKDVGGKLLLWSGDASRDGSVDAADRSASWNARNQTGYLSEDVNLDGVCDAADRSIGWNHRNKGALLP